MDYKRIKSRFHQLGGFRLVREYARSGVLPSIGMEFVRIVLSGKLSKLIDFHKLTYRIGQTVMGAVFFL